LPNPTTPNLTALLGSRICHDLINPLGAIGNGIELLGLAGVAEGEEMTLVSGSVENGTAKLKFLRLAFGDAAADQVVARADLLATLDAVACGGRLSYSWSVAADHERLEVWTALLAVMCVETALPLGGDIEVSNTDGTWAIFAKHDGLKLDPALWVPLSKGECPPVLSASQVHFGLLTTLAQDANQTLMMCHGSDWVKISF
jgi:histidine phosphotransferase ChpT